MGERRERALPDHGVRRAHVDQIRGMYVHRETGGGHVLPQCLFLVGVPGGERPGPRVGHEHLDRLGSDRGRIAQALGGQAAGHGHVRADRSRRGAGRVRWHGRRRWHRQQRSQASGREARTWLRSVAELGDEAD